MVLDVNKAWILTDIHFGAKNNNQEFLAIQKEYFRDFFIPLLKEKKQDNDILFVLGDVTDSRQSLNIMVMNVMLEIFEEISSIIPIKMICGNHDVTYKSSNDINSLKIFNYIPNIKLYQEPETLKLKNGKTIFLMPWRTNAEVEKETLENIKADYLFCHTEYKGAYQNKFAKAEDGIEIDDFSKFKKVISGHIHYRSERNNVILAGSPYQITRSDIGNKKGIYILDTLTGEHEFIENNYSPKFIKIALEDLFNMKVSEFKKIVNNNFVDLLTPAKWSTTFPFSTLLDLTDTYRKINISIVSSDDSSNNESLIEDLSDLDVQHLTKQYIGNLPYTDKIKGLIEKYINNLYQRVLFHENEEE